MSAINEYIDFIVTITPGSRTEKGQTYRVAVRAPSGEEMAGIEAVLPFTELELENRLKDFRIAALSSSSRTRHVRPVQEVDTVRNFGQVLFDALFHGQVLSLYDASRKQASDANKGLRLRLSVQADELVVVPWEYLFDVRHGDYICLNSLTPIIRHLTVLQPMEPLTIQPPLRILGMVCVPRDQQSLDVVAEQKRLQEAIKPLEDNGLVKLEWVRGSTWRDLRDALKPDIWHIFHFIGHGGFEKEGFLYLTDSEGREDPLPAVELARLLANHKALKLVVLNACEGGKSSAQDPFSGVAATLIRSGIPAVLAMQYEISDRAAIELAREFYGALAENRPVESALTEARIAIAHELRGTIEWGVPVLFMHSTGGLLFRTTGVITPTQPQPGPTVQSGPPPQETRVQVQTAPVSQPEITAPVRSVEVPIETQPEPVQAAPIKPAAAPKKSTAAPKKTAAAPALQPPPSTPVVEEEVEASEEDQALIDSFAPGSFKSTIIAYCAQIGWDISSLDDSHAVLEFTMDSGRNQLLFIVRLESTMAFFALSILVYNTTDEIPHPLSTKLMMRNTEKKIGYWCIMEIEGKQDFACMHNAELELIDVAYFQAVVTRLVEEVDEFNTACLEEEDDDRNRY